MSDITFELFETEFDESSVLECKFGQYIVGEKGEKGDKGEQGDEGSLTPDDTALLAAYTASAASSANKAQTSADSAANSASAAASTAAQAATQTQQAVKDAQAAATSASGSATQSSANASAAAGSQTAAAASATQAASSSTSASTSANLARDWATKTDGMVSGLDYSAKWYAQQSSGYANAAAGSASSAAGSASAAAGSAAAAAGSAQDAANSAASIDTTKFVMLDGSRAMTAPLKTPGLALQGSGPRITGDFSNATLANRLFFQTITTDQGSSIGVMPNGAGNGASILCFGKSDLANSSYFYAGSDNAGNVNIQAARTGTGPYGPMIFYTSGAERVRITTNGRVQINTIADTGEQLQVNGFVRSTSSNIAGAVGVYRGLWYQTGNINRIGLGVTASPESGGNLGSDFSIDRYADNGTWLGTGLTIGRANGYITIPGQTQHNASVNMYGSGQLSSALIFQAGASYAPSMRSNNALPGFEFVNSAGNAVPLQISDTGNMILKLKYQTTGGAVGASNSAFQSSNQDGWGFTDWINSPVALQVDCANAQAAYLGIKWTRWTDRHFAAIGAIQNASNQSSIAMYIQGASTGWAWLHSLNSIVRYDNYSCALNPPSDYRLKTNVKDLTGSLDRLMASRPVSFDWTTTGEPDVGFLAHELQQCEPGAVSGTKDAMKEADALTGGRAGEQVPDYQSVNYLYLVTDLVASVRELKTQLDAALNRIATLEGAAAK